MKTSVFQSKGSNKENFICFLLVIFFLALYIFLFEIFSSSPYIFSLIEYPSPSMDSIFPELDVKLQRLWKSEDINCLFLGSSMVDAGLEPVVFEDSLNSRLNTHYKCFNFGFSSSMVEVSGSIGNFFQNTRPINLIIWGISPIDMDPNFTKTRPIAKMPAFSYFNGDPTFTGWLYNNFSLPWIVGSLPHYKNENYRQQLAYYDGILDDRGVRRITEIGEIEVGNQPIFLSDYHLNQTDIDAIEKTIYEAKKNGVKIIFVEMPIHPGLYPYLVDNGDEGYKENFLNPMKAFFLEQEIPFIETESHITDIVNDSHWVNNYHLNIYGAELFTDYILDRIEQEGLLP